MNILKIFRKKLRSYVIVTAKSDLDLQIKVGDMLQKGFTPIGGVNYSQMKIGGNQYDYAKSELWSQAMIK